MSGLGVCSVHPCIPGLRPVAGTQQGCSEDLLNRGQWRDEESPRLPPDCRPFEWGCPAVVGTRSGAPPHPTCTCWGMRGRQEHWARWHTSPWDTQAPARAPRPGWPRTAVAGRGWDAVLWVGTLQSSRDRSPGEVWTGAGQCAGGRVRSCHTVVRICGTAVGSGSAPGRLFDSLVPQFPHQENADMAVGKTEFINVDLYCPAAGKDFKTRWSP